MLHRAMQQCSMAASLQQLRQGITRITASGDDCALPPVNQAVEMPSMCGNFFGFERSVDVYWSSVDATSLERHARFRSEMSCESNMYSG
mmetsp:Transcript_35134/g.64250  ORF Transcript_35134/g.64250 Transcript_35134/m.64250 type:complete len:89 (-) Transcript_35134:4-270(-)